MTGALLVITLVVTFIAPIRDSLVPAYSVCRKKWSFNECRVVIVVVITVSLDMDVTV